MVGALCIGCGGDANIGLVVGMDGGGGGYGGGGGGYILIQWEDNEENITLGADPNAPLFYAPVLEHHHPIMSTLGDPRGRSER